MKSYTTIVGLVLLCVGGSATATAQIVLPEFITLSDSTAPAPLADAFKLDYVVPDGPAFSLVEDAPSNLLRPASIRSFALSVASFATESDGISIPKTFAFEFSPGLLIGGKRLTLAEYRKNPLNWIRLSGATERLAGQGGPSEIAFGLRFTVKDDADPRRNNALLVGLDSLNQLIFDAIGALPPAMQLAMPSGVDPGSDAFFQRLPDSVKTRIQTLVGERVALLSAQAQQNSSETWNKRTIDMATALRFSTQDSLGRGIRTTELAAWFTAGTGVGTWGQALFGVQGSLVRDTSAAARDDGFKGGGSAGLRLYFGSNRYKAFTEAQLETTRQAGERVETLLLNGGGEARLADGTWISFGGGVEYDFVTARWGVVSQFSVKLGLPFLRRPS